jgi:5-methylcytosine-specific restriction endonuclease McrA
MSAHSAVLFLDAEYRPLRVEPWQRAMADMFLGKIEVLEFSRDRTIRGVSRDFQMPSVVRVIRHFKRERIRIKFSRLNIYARDKFVCQYCGLRFNTEDLTFDHVQPKSRGGRTSWENIVTCCIDDNTTKADRTPEEAGMRLLSKPRKPAFLPAITVKMDKSQIPDEWRAYWSGVLET